MGLLAIIKRGNGLVRLITAIAAVSGVSFAAGGYIVNEITFRAALKQALPQVTDSKKAIEVQSEHLKDIDSRIDILTRNTCRLLIIIYAQKHWPLPEDCEVHREDIHSP